MTKTELQIALAEATHTNKKNRWSILRYENNGEFVLTGFGKLVEQRGARTGFNPKTNRRSRLQPRP
jgi:nucleoid DNA-binding protein